MYKSICSRQEIRINQPHHVIDKQQMDTNKQMNNNRFVKTKTPKNENKDNPVQHSTDKKDDFSDTSNYYTTQKSNNVSMAHKYNDIYATEQVRRFNADKHDYGDKPDIFKFSDSFEVKKVKIRHQEIW